MFSTDAMLNASLNAAGLPKVPSSHLPNASSVVPLAEKFKPELPAEITGRIPASRACLRASPVTLDIPLIPLSEPKDMLIMSAPSFTEASTAAAISASSAPCLSGSFENTFIARS